jgi:hypothetical protein
LTTPGRSPGRAVTTLARPAQTDYERLVSPKSEKPHPSGRLPAKRSRRIVLVGLVIVAAGFIGMSTWQLAAQVFGYAPASFPVSAPCASALRSFVASVDRAPARPSGGPDPVAAQLASVEVQCATGKDYEGFVAAKRLRDAVLASNTDQSSDLARFRRAVDMRLSP